MQSLAVRTLISDLIVKRALASGFELSRFPPRGHPRLDGRSNGVGYGASTRRFRASTRGNCRTSGTMVHPTRELF